MEVVIGASEDGLINDTIKDCNQVDHHNQTNNLVIWSCIHLMNAHDESMYINYVYVTNALDAQ